LDSLRSFVARLRRPAAVPSGDLPSLRGAAIRTRLVRIGLAVALVAVFGLAVLASRSPGETRSDIVPRGTTGVVVIDLSKSIIDREFATIGATLRRLIATDTRTGVVVFSDVPYELLPPGSPASALVPLLRFFTPVNGVTPANPWQATFRAGTTISAALELAHQMLLRDNVAHGSIVLVSDLETAPSDYAALTQTLVQLRSEHVLVRAVPLISSDNAKQLFLSVLGRGYLLAAPSAVAPDSSSVQRKLVGRIPVALLVLGGLLLLGLAANERWCTRLALPEGMRRMSP
jgi:VWA domain-containing protein